MSKDILSLQIDFTQSNIIMWKAHVSLSERSGVFFDVRAYHVGTSKTCNTAYYLVLQLRVRRGGKKNLFSTCIVVTSVPPLSF